jgi:hypothetical protein
MGVPVGPHVYWARALNQGNLVVMMSHKGQTLQLVKDILELF